MIKPEVSVTQLVQRDCLVLSYTPCINELSADDHQDLYYGQWVYYVTSFYTYIFSCGVYFKERSVG